MNTVEAEVVDAEVIPDNDPTTSETTSAEVAVVTPNGHATGVLMPFEAAEVGKAMQAYQAAVDAVLDPTDWQGEPGAKGSFVKKSGWRKIAKAFGLSVTRVESGVERSAEGDPIRAWSVYRATGPNGQSQDGDGYCSVDESRFGKSGGRQKLENDMRATATTRAKNRAISDLVGMGEVSAEEVEVGGTPQQAVFEGDMMPAWGVIEDIVGTEATMQLSQWILKDNGGDMPMSVGRALQAVTRMITKTWNDPQVAADDEKYGETMPEAEAS